MRGTGDIVSQYRIFHLDGSGRVSSTDWLDADGDQAAISAARDRNSLHCELWQGRRLVTRLNSASRGLAPTAARREASSA